MAALHCDHSNPGNKSLIRRVIPQQAEGQQDGFPKSALLLENSHSTLIYTAPLDLVTVYGKKILLETKAQLLRTCIIYIFYCINLVIPFIFTNQTMLWVYITDISAKKSPSIFDLVGLTQRR